MKMMTTVMMMRRSVLGGVFWTLVYDTIYAHQVRQAVLS